MLRTVFGHYPTGVCAITSMDAAGPIGMVVGSFTSVSLDPPLVAVLPGRTSTTWPRLEATGRFCVNVLSAQQRDVCSELSKSGVQKFDRVGYRLSSTGLPIIDRVVAWIECSLFAVHDAGDHHIVVGQVEALEVEHPEQPLLFFRGGYGSFAAAPVVPADG